MKKIIYAFLIACFLVPATSLFMVRTARAQQQINMLTSTVQVDPDVNQAVIDTLNSFHDQLPDPSLFYCITDVSPIGDYLYVSIVGLKLENPEQEWNVFDNGEWFGMVIVWKGYGKKYVGAFPGSHLLPDDIPFVPQDNPTLDPNPKTSKSKGIDQSTNGLQDLIFPWEAGKSAMYGPIGVHLAGYGLSNWQAVDFVGGADYQQTYNSYSGGIFGMQDGTIDYVCRDGSNPQVTVKAGLLVYGHLSNSSFLTIGSQIKKGIQFASVSWGPFDNACGYAEQQEDHYHLHLGFPRTPYLGIENCVLDTAPTAGTWTCNGSEEVAATGWLTAGDNGNTGGGEVYGPVLNNFWDSIVTVYISIAFKVFGVFPDHEAIGLGTFVLSIAEVVLKVSYWILLTNFDMTWPKYLLLAVLTLEGVRYTIATINYIKKIVMAILPLLG